MKPFLGSRFRMFMIAAMPAVVMGIAMHFLLERTVRQETISEARHNLGHMMDYAGMALAPAAHESPSELAEKVARIAKAGGVRVTLLDLDGVVLADSEMATDRVSAMENHATRPEVVGAISDGEGSSTRFSDTIGVPLMYLARKLQIDDRQVILRLAYTMYELDDKTMARQRVLLILLSVVFVSAMLLALLVSGLQAKRVQQIAQAALRMAEGEYQVRINDSKNDELSRLAGALNKLAEANQATFKRLENESHVVRAIIDAMAEGVVAVDGEGRITLINRAMVRLAGHPDAKVHDYIDDCISTPELLQSIEEAQNGQGVNREMAVEMPKEATLLVNAVPLSVNGSALMVVHDTTELHRLHQVRRDFVANVSHELRNPVATIQAAAETLSEIREDAADSPDETRLLATIERQTFRMANLVRDLLDLARIEGGEFAVDPQSIDIEDFLSQIVSSFEMTAEGKTLSLSLNIAADFPPCTCDPAALQTVVTNLLDNAVKYTSPGDSVTVRAGRERYDTVFIEISDTGPGIGPDHLPRIFERFYRVDNGRSRELGGTGLGLSIVKHLMSAMGGKVSVTSTPGQGSTFRITLPSCQSSTPTNTVEEV